MGTYSTLSKLPPLLPFLPLHIPLRLLGAEKKEKQQKQERQIPHFAFFLSGSCSSLSCLFFLFSSLFSFLCFMFRVFVWVCRQTGAALHAWAPSSYLSVGVRLSCLPSSTDCMPDLILDYGASQESLTAWTAFPLGSDGPRWCSLFVSFLTQATLCSITSSAACPLFVSLSLPTSSLSLFH